MASVNKVLFLGRLTRDPEVKMFASGGKVADDASSMLKVPLMIAAAGLAAMLVMRGPP